jgi:hypothetical protein
VTKSRLSVQTSEPTIICARNERMGVIEPDP